MMAKMFYTMEEAKSALGKSEEEIKQFAREGKLREFRDGPRLMFKADQVEQLKAEVAGGGGLDQVDLGVSDSGGLIGLVDTTGASGTSITLSDADTGQSSSAGGLKMKDDTALAADLGLSGSLGGVPSPGRVQASPTGTGLSGSFGGRSPGGINVFGADDVIERVDPSAQTAISGGIREQMELQQVGSGSGLLDLTRESDDTSLGAELLDEIAPGAAKGKGRGRATESGIAAATMDEGRRVITPPTQYVEAMDPMAPAFAGMAFAASLFTLVGCLVVACATLGTRPAVVDMIAGKPADNRPLWMIAAFGVAAVAVMGIVGLVIGKSK
jgi:hypothetical protein